MSKIFLSFLMFLVVTDLQTIAAITPQISQGLETNSTTVSYSFVVYSLSAVLSALFLNWFDGGKIAKFRLLPLAAVFYTFSNCLAAFAPNTVIFLISRSFSGIAGGFVSALVIAALANGADYKKRGANMNFITFSYFIAPMVGVPLNTFLADFLGWRIVFVIIGLIVFLNGIFLYFFPLSAIVKKREYAISEQVNLSNSLRMGIISAFFVSGSIIGFTTFLGVWMFDFLKADLEKVGFIYALINFGGLIGGMSGGFLADKFGKRNLALHPNLLMALGLFLLPVIIGNGAVLVVLGMVAFAAALRISPLQALLTELITPSERASYIAKRNIASQIGISASILVCGQVYLTYSLSGVSLICAILALGAWITIKGIVEPSELNEPIVSNAV